MATVVRTDKEINEVLNRCIVAENEGTSAYPDMTYEQGVKYAIGWLLDKASDPVFEE